MVVENRVVPLLDDVIQVAKIVQEANRIFLKDQVLFSNNWFLNNQPFNQYVTLL
jgi:hypothetical protein